MNPIIPRTVVGQAGPVALYGFAHARPDRFADLESLLLSFVAATRAEPGSWQYQVHRDTEKPTTLVFYELWRSSEDLTAHLALPTMADFLDRRMEYLASDLEIHWLRPLSAGAGVPAPAR